MDSDSSGLLLALLIIFFASILIWILVACFKKVSDWRIFKNREKYFKLNKSICSKTKRRGEALLKERSSYLDYLADLGLNDEKMVSNSIVSNSSQNPIKYLLKYSAIKNDIKDLGRLEFVSRFMTDYELFIRDIGEARDTITKGLPLFDRLFADKQRLPYTVCELDCVLSSIKKPFLKFSYISPAGKSRNSNNIVIDQEIIEVLASEISKSINKKGHSKIQRSIMTNDLREAIKKRDNYTCQKCGNSVYKEPNLLLEVDHIVPIAKGGKTEASNLQTLCWRCNRLKGDK